MIHGLLTIDGHLQLTSSGKTVKVLLNGEDVTGRCFVADDRVGYVGLYKLRNGQVYANELGDVATETVFGDVQIGVSD